MVIRFFKKWYWYFKIRRDLKIGKTLTVYYKVGVNFEEYSLEIQKKYLNTEAHKIMMKYDMELDFEYSLENVGDDFTRGLEIVIIKFKQK